VSWVRLEAMAFLDTGVRAYQGEVTGKEHVHERFRAKVKQSASLDGFDAASWQDLRSILDLVLDAFLDHALHEQLCEHSGRSQARIRVKQIRPT
jgi:hypothetical protein